jgi:predicted cupin superfamily sugar epimerase
MMKQSATFWAQQLQMLPHPEGGWYKEVYRSQGTIPAMHCLKDLKESAAFAPPSTFC